MPTLSKIAPSFWFVKEAEEAANLYVSAFPDSRIDRVWTLEVDTPSGPPGSVKVVEFTLAGQSFTAMDAGKLDDFNHAISFTVNCTDQAEIDHYWSKLSAGGDPNAQACGWLKDKYGLSWQIVPDDIEALVQSPGSVAALKQMKKIDTAAMKAAA